MSDKFQKSPGVTLFATLWKEFRACRRRDCLERGWTGDWRMSPNPETWAKYGPRLQAAWYDIVEESLGPRPWKSLKLFMRWWDVRKRIWLEPGNVLFTKTGRKRKRKVQRPRNPTIQILDDGLVLAEESFMTMKYLEGVDDSRLMATILALAGSIYSGPGRDAALYSKKETRRTEGRK